MDLGIPILPTVQYTYNTLYEFCTYKHNVGIMIRNDR